MTRVTEPRREAPPGGFRERLLAGLAKSISEKGYRATTVGDIVKAARTSRRTFYEHFPDKETCFVTLMTESNATMIRHITAAVDPSAPWERQVRQAVEAWIASAESERDLMLSWIRDVPALGDVARRLQRETQDAFAVMIQTLCDTDELRAAGIGPVSPALTVLLLGGLRELFATTVEDGRNVSDVTEIAVHAAIALLKPST